YPVALSYVEDDYKNCFRMSDENVNYLLEKVRPFILKQDTVVQNAITPEARIAATLRFLARGRSFEDLKFATIISPQALGKTIPETCKAIYKALKQEYLKFPTSSQEWQKIATDFESMWNFPNCGGCLDGKHVAIVKPADEWSYYFNNKGYHSVVLLGFVDANLEFIMADIGCNGRVSDGGVIEEKMFHRKLKNGELAL
ncbi:Putative nuclease HARBI1, partial [Zootermopsis nevadensis]